MSRAKQPGEPVSCHQWVAIKKRHHRCSVCGAEVLRDQLGNIEQFVSPASMVRGRGNQ